jgi:hypothetical protein
MNLRNEKHANPQTFLAPLKGAYQFLKKKEKHFEKKQLIYKSLKI